jgi:hypothetical protein
MRLLLLRTLRPRLHHVVSGQHGHRPKDLLRSIRSHGWALPLVGRKGTQTALGGRVLAAEGLYRGHALSQLMERV